MNVYLVLSVGLICYFIVPFIIIVFIKNRKVSNVLMTLLLIAFLVILFLGIYCKVYFVDDKVFVKPDFSGEWMSKTVNFKFNIVSKFDFFINLILLIPIGIVTRYLTKDRKAWARILIILVVAFVSGILTELGQFILPIPRSVQLTDSVLNMISVLIGAIVASFYYFIRKKRLKRRRK